LKGNAQKISVQVYARVVNHAKLFRDYWYFCNDWHWCHNNVV